MLRGFVSEKPKVKNKILQLVVNSYIDIMNLNF